MLLCIEPPPSWPLHIRPPELAAREEEEGGVGGWGEEEQEVGEGLVVVVAMMKEEEKVEGQSRWVLKKTLIHPHGI
jgi:hypothetical protein